MPDTASPSAPQPAMSDPGELRHTLTVEDIGVLLTQAGVPRSRRQVIRYCQTGLLEAVKIPGPTGDQWYVAPASLPKAIGDLKQWEAQRERQGTTQLDMSSHVHPVSDPVTLRPSLEMDSDMASHSEPKHAMSDLQNGSTSIETEPDTARHGAPKPDTVAGENNEKGSGTLPDVARHAWTEPDIYHHPYVKKLEERVEKAEARYEAQVHRTEEIQIRSQNALIELQRMVAVGQSQTLADFMLKAREWVLGANDADKKEEGSRVDNSTQ